MARADKSLKVVLIGDSSVGKSALFNRIKSNSVPAQAKATVGIDFAKIPYQLSNGEEQLLQVWDTAGQEKFQSVTTHHYRGTDGVMIVYDITNQSSFFNVGRWLAEVRDNTDEGVPIVLVGNKIDLADRRTVDPAEAQAFAAEEGMAYLETSALLEMRAQGGMDTVLNYLLEQIASSPANRSRLVRGYRDVDLEGRVQMKPAPGFWSCLC
jgi:small GTP-binding protein